MLFKDILRKAIEIFTKLLTLRSTTGILCSVYSIIFVVAFHFILLMS